MNIKIRFLLVSAILFYGTSYGQMDTYSYKTELRGITGQWHGTILPDAVFEKVSPDLSDIRIYGITPANDTVEAPYLLRIKDEKRLRRPIDFKLLNTSRNEKGYYYTYEIPTKEAINHILLSFGNDNFDWHIALEGSQNQNEWFTILEDYRILSLKNDLTDYQFTDLNFPNAQYRFYRLRIHSDKEPRLHATQIVLDEKTTADYQSYKVGEMRVDNVADRKQSVIDIDLKKYVPLSYLKIGVQDQLDYYRPLTVQYRTDSVQTEKGWKYNYANLTKATLNSIDGNEFRFNSTIVRHLRLLIDNHDNHPLHINKVEAKGYIHELIARFAQPASYYLVYGNALAHTPQYDISETTSPIPENLTPLKLGETQTIPKKEGPTVEPLFKNKFWLWGLMGIIIAVLGGFTLQMMRKR